jgi:transposase-like protein
MGSEVAPPSALGLNWTPFRNKETEMKKSRYTQEQIIAVLKQHQASLSTAELCRKHGISEATFYNWRSRYGGMEVSEAPPAEEPRGREP